MMSLPSWFMIGGTLMVLGVISGLWFHWNRRPPRRPHLELPERQEPTLETDLLHTEDAHSLRNQVGHLGDLTPEHPLADKILMDVEIRPITPDPAPPLTPVHTPAKRVFSIPAALKREKTSPPPATDDPVVRTATREPAQASSTPLSDPQAPITDASDHTVKSVEKPAVENPSVKVAVPTPPPTSVLQPSDEPARSASVACAPATAKITVALTVLAPQSQPFIGSNILKVAYELQIKLHRSGVLDCFMPDVKKPICSIVHLREPGTFHIANIQQMAIPGLLIFTHLPAAIDAVAALNFTLATGQELAKRLGGTLCDDQHNRINTRKIVQLRNKVAEFERSLHRLSP